jgi:hypothetical protein
MSPEYGKGIQVLRLLYRELRPSVQEPNKHVYQTATWKYIVSQCRQTHQEPESSNMMVRVGEYYHDAIKGTREYLRLHNLYKGKGERSPKDLAQILGFRMPDDPTPDPRRMRKDGSTTQPGPDS